MTMDIDEIFAGKSGDPLSSLGRQDLDPLSIEECALRIAALEAEILRVKERMSHAVNHRASAHDIFKR